MTIDERRKVYLDYLHLKISECDWHGVADAAMDLRELEVESKLAPAPVTNYVEGIFAEYNKRKNEWGLKKPHPTRRGK